jgi:hypothetical protein
MKLEDRAEEILESLWVELVEGNVDACDVGLLKDDESKSVNSVSQTKAGMKRKAAYEGIVWLRGL